MDRRQFLKSAAATTAVWTFSHRSSASTQSAPAPLTAAAPKLPVYKGFNLLEKFSHARPAPFREKDFEIMAEWGFNFVRLPMSYLCWTDPTDVRKVKEEQLRDIDQAVEWGKRYGLHINLNFHRAPGYCVNPPAEPTDLWTQEEALENCAWHWELFSTRYKGIASDRLSFNLLNEPKDIPEATYVRVARRLVEGIRGIDPQRVIFADGVRWGTRPVHGFLQWGLVQSTRGYAPMQISHHKASWIQGSSNWPEPTWPLTTPDGKTWDRARLQREYVEPFREIQGLGAAVHVGEWGAFQYTPHDAALAWMRDCLANWKEAGWGWALWNLRGGFGLLDTHRQDAAYEDFKGHKLDRKMLEVLKEG